MGPVYVTVIGQCMGAGDTDQAAYYFKKLLKISLVFGVVWNGLVLAATPLLLQFYQLSPETKDKISVALKINSNNFKKVLPSRCSLG